MTPSEVAQVLPLRCFSREQAARYLSLSLSAFDSWVRQGIIPGPVAGTHRWDRKAIDLALDKRSNIVVTMPSAYDEWKAGQDESAS